MNLVARGGRPDRGGNSPPGPPPQGGPHTPHSGTSTPQQRHSPSRQDPYMMHKYHTVSGCTQCAIIINVLIIYIH